MGKRKIKGLCSPISEPLPPCKMPDKPKTFPVHQYLKTGELSKKEALLVKAAYELGFDVNINWLGWDSGMTKNDNGSQHIKISLSVNRTIIRNKKGRVIKRIETPFMSQLRFR